MARGNMRMCFFTTREHRHSRSCEKINCKGHRQIQLANVIIFVNAAVKEYLN